MASTHAVATTATQTVTAPTGLRIGVVGSLTVDVPGIVPRHETLSRIAPDPLVVVDCTRGERRCGRVRCTRAPHDPFRARRRKRERAACAEPRGPRAQGGRRRVPRGSHCRARGSRERGVGTRCLGRAGGTRARRVVRTGRARCRTGRCGSPSVVALHPGALQGGRAHRPRALGGRRDGARRPVRRGCSVGRTRAERARARARRLPVSRRRRGSRRAGGGERCLPRRRRRVWPQTGAIGVGKLDPRISPTTVAGARAAAQDLASGGAPAG